MREYVKRESNRSIKEDINKMKWLTGFFNVFSRLREIIIFCVTIKCRVYAILRFFFFFFVKTFPMFQQDDGGIFPSKHFLPVTKYAL